jgi:hypothetical protein
MRRVCRVSEILFGVGLAVAFAQPAAAQSVDIPLNYALNTGYNFGSQISNPVLILTINVGVNGGAAKPYAFDTGSAVFPKRRAHRGDVIAFGIKRQHRHLRGCSRIHRQCVSGTGVVV